MQNKTNKTKAPVMGKQQLRVCKGVYKRVNGTYIARPVVNGKMQHYTFTSKKAAIAFYNKIVKYNS